MGLWANQGAHGLLLVGGEGFLEEEKSDGWL